MSQWIDFLVRMRSGSNRNCLCWLCACSCSLFWKVRVVLLVFLAAGDAAAAGDAVVVARRH